MEFIAETSQVLSDLQFCRGDGVEPLGGYARLRESPAKASSPTR